MAILTIVLFVSMAFALGDAMIRPKTPCERARDAAIIGAYIPTCDHAGQYTPKQCFGSTGKHGRTYTLNSVECYSKMCNMSISGRLLLVCDHYWTEDSGY
uniref:Thyroglobulin type-1 domain-containing protein n=1 Tax=Hucho hucho TaxID=62062 RepID=A0A4W5LU21_9TELE